VTSEEPQPIVETSQPRAPEPDAPLPESAVATEPLPETRPKARGGMAGWLNVALGLAVAVAIGGVAFAAGRMTAPASAIGANPFGNGPNGRVFTGNGYAPGNIQGGGPNGQSGPRVFDGAGSIEGTVTAVTADSITIKTAAGQEITIALDSTTTYHQQSSATSTDVRTGGTVIVRLGLGNAGSGTQTGPTANDVTVVPQ
jgi:hypothetical protein